MSNTPPTDPTSTLKPHDTRAHIDDAHTPDAVEAVLPMMPIVLPIVGGVLMFLLAFIAIYMA